jgi:hypothetical protein
MVQAGAGVEVVFKTLDPKKMRIEVQKHRVVVRVKPNVVVKFRVGDEKAVKFFSRSITPSVGSFVEGFITGIVKPSAGKRK